MPDTSSFALLEPKDYITFIFSLLAFLVAVTSLLVNIMQKKGETRRSLRKTFTDTLSEITKINIEVAKLRHQEKDLFAESVVNLRRSYNTQRRNLINIADELVTRYPEIARRETDYVIMADSFGVVSDFANAEKYWKKAIEHAKGASKIYNTRGYARFLYEHGRYEEGNAQYELAMGAEVADNDRYRREKADTAVMWAIAAKTAGRHAETVLAMGLARQLADTITHPALRAEVERQMAQLVARGTVGSVARTQ